MHLLWEVVARAENQAMINGFLRNPLTLESSTTVYSDKCYSIAHLWGESRGRRGSRGQ